MPEGNPIGNYDNKCRGNLATQPVVMEAAFFSPKVMLFPVTEVGSSEKKLCVELVGLLT